MRISARQDWMPRVRCSSQQHELTHFLKPFCTSNKGQLNLELLWLLQPIKAGAHSQEQAAERNPVCRGTWLWSSLKSIMLVNVKTFPKKSIIVKIIQDFHFPELLRGVAAKASWGSTMHQTPLQKAEGRWMTAAFHAALTQRRGCEEISGL